MKKNDVCVWSQLLNSLFYAARTQHEIWESEGEIQPTHACIH